MVSRLSGPSKTLVEKYVRDGLLSKDIYALLWRANSKNDIMNAFRSEVSINEINNSKVWTHLINVEWNDLQTVFDSKEIIVLKDLLKNDGAILRTRISATLMNEYMTTIALQKLEEREVINILTLESNEKIVILSPRFKKKVFPDATKPDE